MKRLLIFSGTTEGRRLAEVVANADIPAVVCVATEYGKKVMKAMPGIEIRQGRMNEVQMQELMQEDFFAVVDATHPYAEEVSANIKKSAGEKGILYLRLLRNTESGAMDENGGANELFFPSNEACAAALTQRQGNVMLTIGSKELDIYCRDSRLRERIYARVLPSEESITQCRKAGLCGKQILALQGPFTEELNAALMEQYQIRYLVTKETGTAGGFWEKEAAAIRRGATFCVIGKPMEEEGLSFSEVCGKLEELAGVSFSKSHGLQISLVGTGMGDRRTLTVEAEEAIKNASYLFGAKRLVDGAKSWNSCKKKIYPYYRASDILPVLEDICRWEENWEQKTISAAILFSGDSGFYSGCQSLYEQLLEWRKTREEQISIRICPGMSSISYFAAACGVSWQDAKIVSLHGKGDRGEWEPELLEAVRCHKKVFLLVSGAADVRTVGTVLREAGLGDCTVLAGYQLSYPEERVWRLDPQQCEEIEKDGLYVLAILHEAYTKKVLGPCRSDKDFVRGKIPMTKAEIRETAICKLKLCERAVVYDIGSGTGSIAVEAAERSGSIRVYAIEQKREGVFLIEQNKKKFGIRNLKVIHGTAPQAFAELPAPTHAFIGGSGGRLQEILEALHEKNPYMRIVLTAISLETVGEIMKLQERFSLTDMEMVQMQVSRVRHVGSYHLMQAENPVYICSFTTH